MRVLFVLICFIVAFMCQELGTQNDAMLAALPLLSRLRFKAFLLLCLAKGWTVLITSGLRTAAQQNALHAKDSRNAVAGHSSHEVGHAIDLNFSKDGVYLRKATDKATWEKSGIPAIAKTLGITWGGTAFKTLYDPVHFQI
jgi:hypothetical protein